MPYYDSFDQDAYSEAGDLSPSLKAWAAGTADGCDMVDLDLDGINLSTAPSDSFEMRDTTTDTEPVILSSMADFVSILAQTGISGPRLLKDVNLATRATKIGAGTQFTVYKEKLHEGYTGNEGLVIKRVNVPLSRKGGQRFADTPEYRIQLRTLGLELLVLCNPLLRLHPNIVQVAAWGYDFPFADMPVPVLFMEAALMPLTGFLAAGSDCTPEVKYQLSLDIANGVEKLHSVGIVHGDLKPENVLVFSMQNDTVPFRAKLSDFGVSIDLGTAGSRFAMSDYRGTPGWLAPEVANDSLARFCPFQPDLMFRFEAYSFGLTVLSIFTNQGKPIDLRRDPQRAAKEVLETHYRWNKIPSTLWIELHKATQRLLANDPRDRPLPNPDMLKTSTSAYASWLSLSRAGAHNAPTAGSTTISMYNKGPLFWYKLDPFVLSELEAQYTASKKGVAAKVPGAVLFGMAQAVTVAKSSYLEPLFSYLTDAATAGCSPARALYAQLTAAHDFQQAFNAKVLEEWMFQAVAEGYLFAPASALTNERTAQAKNKFRQNGGFAADPFLGKRDVVEAARIPKKAIQWKMEHGLIVDHVGNTILHAAAALGCLDTICALLDNAGMTVNVENAAGETPLYKACQAGHAEIVKYLLQRKASACCTARQRGISPLHWLFMFPEDQIHSIARKLVAAGADVNAVIQQIVVGNSGGFPGRIQISHYPFELPLGTPLHWAAFFRNLPAMDTLISLGANVNAVYHGHDNATTPLALAAWLGDLEVSKYLLSRGANGRLKDSMGRNILHGITKQFPHRHGYLPQRWHAWVRQGNWDNHLNQTRNLTQLLLKAGADINSKDQASPRLTPIAAAADLGVWNGAGVRAFLDAGAYPGEPTSSTGDTVLHYWASAVGSALDYPRAYIPTLRSIVALMPDIDVRNIAGKTPLHILASIDQPEDQFEQACEILLGRNPGGSLNAQSRWGETPLSIALGTRNDPTRRGLFLLRNGALANIFTDDGKDIFFAIANNPFLHDQDSANLISSVLHHIDLSVSTRKSNMKDKKDSSDAYQRFFLHNQGAIHTLIAAVTRGKLRTTSLLLSLGLRVRLNDFDPSQSRRFTTIDHVLYADEASRLTHEMKLARYKPGPAQRAAVEEQVVYDDEQGPPSRAAEAYHAFPDLLRCLRQEGGKRACELDVGRDAAGGTGSILQSKVVGSTGTKGGSRFAGGGLFGRSKKGI